MKNFGDIYLELFASLIFYIYDKIIQIFLLKMCGLPYSIAGNCEKIKQFVFQKSNVDYIIYKLEINGWFSKIINLNDSIRILILIYLLSYC